MSTPTGSIATWLLGGALLASLGWNAVTLRQTPRPDPASAPAPAVDGSGSCAATLEKLGDIGLDAGQREQLAALLRQCDEGTATSDASAAELARQLQSLLRDPAVDAATIRARAKELGALRAAAVEQCVESSLALRELLTAEQLGKLLDVCCGEGCGEACGGER